MWKKFSHRFNELKFLHGSSKRIKFKIFDWLKLELFHQNVGVFFQFQLSLCGTVKEELSENFEVSMKK